MNLSRDLTPPARDCVGLMKLEGIVANCPLCPTNLRTCISYLEREMEPLDRNLEIWDANANSSDTKAAAENEELAATKGGACGATHMGEGTVEPSEAG